MVEAASQKDFGRAWSKPSGGKPVFERNTYALSHCHRTRQPIHRVGRGVARPARLLFFLLVTLEQAVVQAEDAITVWIEAAIDAGQDIPAPSDIERCARRTLSLKAGCGRW